MKKILICFVMLFSMDFAYAKDSGITTSQAYVTTKATEKQDTVPGNNANSVMIYDSNSANGIGAKAIYDSSASYASQQDALVTAATANAAIQNAIDNEFTCANPPKCTLWHMTGLFTPTSPVGYTELEYIDSTGNQYIDTGFVAQYTDCFYMNAMVLYQDQGNIYRPLFGAARDGTQGKFYVSVGHASTWFANYVTSPQLITNQKSKVYVCTDSTGFGTMYIDDIKARQADITMENLSLKLFLPGTLTKTAQLCVCIILTSFAMAIP